MNSLKSLYRLVYEKHFKDCIIQSNIIHKDVENILLGYEVNNQKLKEVVHLIEKKANLELDENILTNINNGILDDLYFAENKLRPEKEVIKRIGQKRHIKNVELNKEPLYNPFKQMIITSNIMLTLPKDYDSFDLKNKYLINMEEQQENWYDHPIPLDVNDESNEIIYGLTNLNKAIKIETDEIVTVILSISVTHNSINKIAKDYVKVKPFIFVQIQAKQKKV